MTNVSHDGVTQAGKPTAQVPTWFRVALATLTIVWWTIVWVAARHSTGRPRWFGRDSAEYAELILAGAIIGMTLSLANLPRPALFLRRNIATGVTFILSCLCALLLAEGLVRILDPLGVSYFAKLEQHLAMLQPDAILGYRLKPNAHADYGDFEVTTNSAGFRSDSMGPLREGDFRILVLGDSVAFGWGVPSEYGVCARLAALATLRSGGSIRTINTGVTSYNTSQEELVFREHLAMRPDVVLLLFVSNDVERNVYDVAGAREVFGHGPSHALQKIVGRSHLYRLVAFSWSQMPWNPTEAPVPAVRPPAWQESLAALRRIAALCNERGIPFIVCMTRMSRSARSDAIATDLAMSARTAGAGFRYCDTVFWFDGRQPRNTRVSVVDAHPNILGHEVLSQGLLAFMTAEGVIPITRQ